MKVHDKIIKIILMSVIIVLFCAVSVTSFAESETGITLTIDTRNTVAETSVSLSSLDSAKDLNLYTAFYDINGDVIKTAVIKNPASNERYQSDIPAECESIKAMLWEKGTNAPICSATSKPFIKTSLNYGTLSDIYTVNSGEYSVAEIITKDRTTFKYHFVEKPIINGDFIDNKDAENYFEPYLLPVMYTLDDAGKITKLYIGADEIQNATGTNSVITLTGKNTKGGAFTSSQASYYQNSAETDKASVKIDISSNLVIYTNKGTVSTSSSFASYWSVGAYDFIHIIDTDSDGSFDYINIVENTPMVVDYIYETKGYIYDPYGRRILLNDSNGYYESLITDTNGNKLSFSDIKTGDIVNVFVSNMGATTLNDVIVSDSKFKGIVGQVVSYQKVMINGKEYSVELYDGQLNSGDNCMFYTDIYGRIIYFETIQDFGLLYAVYPEVSGIESEAKAIIYTADGEFITYDFADNVAINGWNYSKRNLINSNGAGTADDTIQNISTAQQLWMYTTNDDGKITGVYYGAGINARNQKYALATETSATYKATTDKVGSYYFAEDTVIIGNKGNGYVSNKDYLFIGTKGLFNEEDIYDFDAIVDDEKNIVLIVVNNVMYKVDKSSTPMYVTNVGNSYDSDGAPVMVVKGYVDGEYKTIKVDYTNTYIYSRNYLQSSGSTVWTPAYYVYQINKGDIIQYVGDGEVVDAVRIIATFDDYKDGVISNIGYVSYDDNTEGFIYMGKVSEIERNCTIMFNDGTNIDFYPDIIADVVQLTSGLNSSYNNSSAGRYSFVDVETDMDYITSNDDYLMVYLFDGEAKAAVILDTESDTVEITETEEPIIPEEPVYTENFGLLYAVYPEVSGIESEAKAIIYTADGEFRTYDFADNVAINGWNYSKETLISPNGAGTADDTIQNISTTQQLWMYTTNDDGKITGVYYGSGINARNQKYALASETYATYKATTDKVGSYYFAEDTVIIGNKGNGYVSNKDYLFIGTKVLFNEEDIYDFDAIIDDDKNIVLIVLNNAVYKADKSSTPMYVTAIGSSVDAVGNSVAVISGYIDGQYKTIKVNYTNTYVYSRKYLSSQSPDVWTDAYTGFITIAKGDIIQYVGDGEVVDAVRIIATFADYKDGTIANTGYAPQDDKNEGFIYMGRADEIIRNRDIIYEDGTEVSFSSSVIAALVQSYGSTPNRIFAAAYAFTDAETNYSYYGDNNDDYILVYKFNDEPMAAVILDTAQDFM